MRKIFVSVFIAACVFASCMDAKEYSGSCGSGVTWTFDDSSNTLSIKGNGDMDDFQYHAPWLDYIPSIETVVIYDYVKNIGRRAFTDHVNLKKVTIPSSVSRIGDEAFYHCESLTEVTVPYGLTSIGMSAFEWCTSLENFDIPTQVTYIGTDAFFYSGLKNVFIPGLVTEISAYSFAGCKNLVNVTISYGPRAIDVAAFSGCSNLENVIMPDTMLYVRNSAFAGCKKLKTLPLVAGVTEIGTSAFENCISLTDVVIPDSVSNLNSDAFRGCTNLRSVTLSENISYVDSRAFSDCSNLTSIFYQGYNPFSSTTLAVSVTDMCTPPDYTAATWHGIQVTPDTEKCKAYRSLFNHCFKADFVDGEFVQRHMINASVCETPNACGFCECDNATGPISWSLCNRSDVDSRVCMFNSCFENWETALRNWKVVMELQGVKYGYMDVLQILPDLEDLTQRTFQFEGVGVGVETNTEGDMLRTVISIDNGASATAIAESVGNLSKTNCKYGVICHVTNITVIESSSAPSLYVMMKGFMLLIIALEVIISFWW